jgi:hypothetical protein
MFSPESPRSQDPVHVYGTAYIQEKDQSIEFYDKRPCLFVGCFWVCVTLLLVYVGIFVFEAIFGPLATYLFGFDEVDTEIVYVEISEDGENEVWLKYVVDEENYELPVKVNTSTFDQFSIGQQVTAYYERGRPQDIRLTKPETQSWSTRRIQFLLRRIALLSVFVAFAWYVLFADRYRTPLEWLRNPFRRA